MELQDNLNLIPILLISDDDDVIRQILSGLRKHAVRDRLSVAQSRFEALEMLSHQNEATPVILLDAGPDSGNGLGFLQELARESERCGSVIFILSSPDDDYDRVPQYGANVAGYLQKPPSGQADFQLDQMLDYVGKTVEPAAGTLTESVCAVSAVSV